MPHTAARYTLMSRNIVNYDALHSRRVRLYSAVVAVALALCLRRLMRMCSSAIAIAERACVRRRHRRFRQRDSTAEMALAVEYLRALVVVAHSGVRVGGSVRENAF